MRSLRRWAGRNPVPTGVAAVLAFYLLLQTIVCFQAGFWGPLEFFHNWPVCALCGVLFGFVYVVSYLVERRRANDAALAPPTEDERA